MMNILLAPAPYSGLILLPYSIPVRIKPRPAYTILFVDVCVVAQIKLHQKTNTYRDAAHANLIAELRKENHPQNAISFFPLLMERVSTPGKFENASALTKELLNDIKDLRRFFDRARLLEPLSLVESYAKTMFRHHPEILGSTYEKFLVYANNLGLGNAVPPSNRIATTQAICEKATQLGLLSSHPVVIAVVACIFGCRPAKELMKFRQNPARFRPGNALGDIMTINRIAKLSSLRNEAAKMGSPYRRTRFLTADIALHHFYAYFEVRGVTATGPTNEAEFINEFEMSIVSQRLFPDLYGTDGLARDESCKQQIARLQKLLGIVL